MTKQNDKATPRPWKSEGNSIVDCDYEHLGDISGETIRQSEANTALIVRAVNEYDAHCDCEKLLKQTQQWLSKFIADRPENDETGIKHRCYMQFEKNEIAIAALAAIREGKVQS